MIALLGKNPLRIVERNALAYRRMWFIFLSGLLEPLLYLLSIGVGVGGLVGGVEVHGRVVPYESFVAPGLLAVAAMNGAVFDTTINFFVKLKYIGTYDTMLATPLSPADVTNGEILWALLRGGAYGAAFLVTMAIMGLTESWWAILGLPAAVLIGFAFAGAGSAASSFMRSFTDFDFVNLAVIPMFLFSGVFFPLSRYPDWLAWIVRATPLYQGVALERGLALGALDWSLVGHAAYLGALGATGVWIAGRRLARLLTA